MNWADLIKAVTDVKAHLSAGAALAAAIIVGLTYAQVPYFRDIPGEWLAGIADPRLAVRRIWRLSVLTA
jgi:hypothetical protein